MATKKTLIVSGSLNIRTVANPPSNPNDGDVYRNASDGFLYKYIGSAWYKLIEGVSLVNSRALVTDANGRATSSATTSTEIGYLSGVSSAVQTQITNITTDISNVKAATLIPTGFEDPANIGLAYDSSGKTVTITHASGTIWFWTAGTRRSAVSPVVSSAHPITTGNYYWLYYDATGTLTWATNTFPGFDTCFVTYVNFGATDKFAIRESHGTEPWQAHEEFHRVNGTYKKSGGLITGGSYATNTNTVDAVTPAVDVATIADEDLTTTIAAMINGSTYTRVHFDTGAAVFTKSSTFPFPDDGTNIQYNQNPISGTALTSITANNTWVNIYLIMVPVTSDAGSQAYRHLWMTGQLTYASLAAAQAEGFNSLYLGDLTSLFSEMVCIAQITYRRLGSSLTRNAQIAANPNYVVGSRQSPVNVIGFTPTTHVSLSGRSDVDQHPAASITNTPHGNITSTDAQAALNELDTLKLGSVSADTAPQLGGNLNLNGKVLKTKMLLGDASSNYMEQEYIDSMTLTGGSSLTTLTNLTFDITVFATVMIEYSIKDTITGYIRSGHIMISADASGTGSAADYMSETGSVGVVWDVAASGNNMLVKYTTTTNDKSMRCLVKRIKKF